MKLIKVTALLIVVLFANTHTSASTIHRDLEMIKVESQKLNHWRTPPFGDSPSEKKIRLDIERKFNEIARAILSALNSGLVIADFMRDTNELSEWKLQYEFRKDGYGIYPLFSITAELPVVGDKQGFTLNSSIILNDNRTPLTRPGDDLELHPFGEHSGIVPAESGEDLITNFCLDAKWTEDAQNLFAAHPEILGFRKSLERIYSKYTSYASLAEFLKEFIPRQKQISAAFKEFALKEVLTSPCGASPEEAKRTRHGESEEFAKLHFDLGIVGRRGSA